MREYEQGESLRRVHWPTTARRGRLMVKELEDSPRESLVVVLDCDPAGDAGTSPESSFDAAVRAAGSILRAHVARGRRSGLVTTAQADCVTSASSLDGEFGAVAERARRGDGRAQPAISPASSSGRRGASTTRAELVVVTATQSPAAARRLLDLASAPRGRRRVDRRAELRGPADQGGARRSLQLVRGRNPDRGRAPRGRSRDGARSAARGGACEWLARPPGRSPPRRFRPLRSSCRGVASRTRGCRESSCWWRRSRCCPLSRAGLPARVGSPPAPHWRPRRGSCSAPSPGSSCRIADERVLGPLLDAFGTGRRRLLRRRAARSTRLGDRRCTACSALAVFGFVAAIALLVAARQPLAAAAVTIAGAGWPATLLDDAAVAVGTLALAGALSIALVLRARSLRTLVGGLVVAALVVGGAAWVSSATSFTREAVVDWQSWNVRGPAPRALGVRFVWEARVRRDRLPADDDRGSAHHRRRTARSTGGRRRSTSSSRIAGSRTRPSSSRGGRVDGSSSTTSRLRRRARREHLARAARRGEGARGRPARRSRHAGVGRRAVPGNALHLRGRNGARAEDAADEARGTRSGATSRIPPPAGAPAGAGPVSAGGASVSRALGAGAAALRSAGPGATRGRDPRRPVLCRSRRVQAALRARAPPHAGREVPVRRRAGARVVAPAARRVRLRRAAAGERPARR